MALPGSQPVSRWWQKVRLGPEFKAFGRQKGRPADEQGPHFGQVKRGQSGTREGRGVLTLSVVEGQNYQNVQCNAKNHFDRANKQKNITVRDAGSQLYVDWEKRDTINTKDLRNFPMSNKIAYGSRSSMLDLKTKSGEREGRGVRALGTIQEPQYLIRHYKHGRKIEGIRLRQGGWTPIF